MAQSTRKLRNRIPAFALLSTLLLFAPPIAAFCSQVVRGLTLATIIAGKDDAKTPKEQVDHLKKIFLMIISIFAKYVTSRKDQASFLSALEDGCIEQPHAFASFQTLVHVMYEHDDEIISEEVILKWFKTSTGLTEEMVTIRKQTEPFITWLGTAEEESDSDSD